MVGVFEYAASIRITSLLSSSWSEVVSYYAFWYDIGLYSGIVLVYILVINCSRVLIYAGLLGDACLRRTFLCSG